MKNYIRDKKKDPILHKAFVLGKTIFQRAWMWGWNVRWQSMAIPSWTTLELVIV